LQGQRLTTAVLGKMLSLAKLRSSLESVLLL
jgi:hypothetical protein